MRKLCFITNCVVWCKKCLVTSQKLSKIPTDENSSSCSAYPYAISENVLDVLLANQVISIWMVTGGSIWGTGCFLEERTKRRIALHEQQGNVLFCCAADHLISNTKHLFLAELHFLTNIKHGGFSCSAGLLQTTQSHQGRNSCLLSTGYIHLLYILMNLPKTWYI